MTSVSLLAFACIGLSAGMASAGDKVLYEPAIASWVKPVAMAKPDPAYSGAPGQVLLQNIQVNFLPDGSRVSYTEIALHIQTPAGLQAAQAYIVWNPDTDQATVHKVQLIRGDQVIDVLAKGQTFTILRREQNLDRAMLDGYLTGILQPEGIQVGDTLVFALSVKQHDPVMGGHAELMMQGLSSGPVALQSVRATWPAAQGVRWRQSDDLRGKLSKSGDTQTYLMERSRVSKPDTLDDAPARFNQFGQIEFSQFAAWDDISKLLAPRFDQAATLKADSPLQKEIATIRAASSDPKVQAAMALHLVENQVRYVYLGMNFGGYIPADADTTWQRRFGDCKGKTVLLTALLRGLGIKAESALVNSGGGDGLDQRLPSLELFDHVIVKAEIDGTTYWMDATRLGDGALDSLKAPALRWALPLRDGGASLTPLPMKPLDKPTSDTFLHLDASAGLDVPAKAHAETVFRGDLATQFNTGFNAIATSERDKALKGYWTGLYDWIEPRKVSATFDPATGEEHVVMDGAAKMEWNESNDKTTWRYEADLMSMGWSYGTDRKAGPLHDAPVLINFPYYERTREEIVLPKGATGFTIEGEPVDKTAGGSEFKRTLAIKDGVVTLEASKRSLVPEISYTDAMAVTDALTKLWKKDVVLIAPKSYHKSTEKADTSGAAITAAATGTTTSTESVSDLMAQASGFIGQNKIDEALTVMNKILRQDDKNTMALQGRAAIFMMRGNYTAAAADLEMALKIDPTLWSALNLLGTVRGAQERPDDAIAAYTKALEIYPNDLDALLYRAHAYLGQKKINLARQDAEMAKDLGADSPQLSALQANIEVADKHIDAARTVIRKALAESPGNVDLHTQMAELLENCTGLDTEACAKSKGEAVAEYDAIIAEEPSAWAYAMRAQDRPKADRAQKLEDIDLALKADPKSELPLMVRASIWLNEDKAYDKALTDLNAALVLAPKNSQIYNIRSRVYFNMNTPDLAIADLDSLKKMFPQAAWAYNSSCWERSTHNMELDTALADCEQAIKLAPDNVAYVDSRAMVRLRQGKLAEALADYNTVLAKAADMGPSLYGRGLVKLRLGDKVGGKADLAAARKVYPNVDEDFAGYGLKP